MKILHVLDHSIPLHSGYTFRTRAILTQQRALGWQTAHVTSAKHGAGVEGVINAAGAEASTQRPSLEQVLEEDVEGFHFYRTPRPSGIARNLPVLNQLAILASLTGRLRQVVAIEQPDVIHAHSPALNGVAALKARGNRCVPVVYEVRAFWEDAAVDHGSCREGDLRYRLTRGLETYALRRVDAVTTICEGLRTEIIARGIGEDRVFVIPNAVDLDQFPLGGDPDRDLVERYGLDGRVVLGFIGSFYAYEGLSSLVESLPKILQDAPGVRVLLVGGGPQVEKLKELARSLAVAEKVHFVGRVPHAEVQRYYDLLDILVYPRLSMRLTELVTPLKPLEAMARGKLVVASDVGGHRELIENGVTGVLFKSGSADELAETLRQILARRDSWPAMRAAARRFVEQQRSWPASVARYQQVYRRAANSAAGA